MKRSCGDLAIAWGGECPDRSGRKMRCYSRIEFHTNGFGRVRGFSGEVSELDGLPLSLATELAVKGALADAQGRRHLDSISVVSLEEARDVPPLHFPKRWRRLVRIDIPGSWSSR